MGDIAKVVDIIDLYSALRDRYTKVSKSDSKLYKTLFKMTKSLFSNILYFQARAACYLNDHIVNRTLGDAFNLEVWADHIRGIENDNRNCQQALQNASHEELAKQITNLQHSMNEEIRLLNQREQKIVDWLSKIRMNSYHREIHLKSEQYLERGHWFIEAIDKWIKYQPNQSAYWLHGICQSCVYHIVCITSIAN